ncbi:hypothetical protein [Sporosalibacterium faouarense]|uniref:hypothetical protein n=1 Tax=Sporosalibacterium faouarense TaxID=516123 RepID=UPI00192BD705|nr:hypothetical protein [Sporosalibacterium faouarense]
MPLPETFDQNEIFVIIFFIITFFVAIKLPKRFSLSTIILILLIGLVVPRISDHLLAPRPYDLYDVLDGEPFELFEIIIYIFFALTSYIFLNIYDRLKPKGINIMLFILISSLIGTIIEYIMAIFNVFQYKEWEIQYSFPVYLLVQSLTILTFHLIQYDKSCKNGKSNL